MDETLTSSVSMPAMCGAEIVPLLVVLGLFLWGRSVADKHGTRGWRLASWMPIAGLVVHHVGVLGTVVGLVRAFDAVSSVPAADRALALSEGIAVAMYATLLGVVASLLLYFASVVAFAVGSLRAAPPRSAP